MELDEDGYDTHFCLGCHMTIDGLDEYVRHKKLECPARKHSTTKSQIKDNQSVATSSTTLVSLGGSSTLSFSQPEVTSSLEPVSTIGTSSHLSPATISSVRLDICDEAGNPQDPTSENWNEFFSSLQLQSKGDGTKDTSVMPDKVTMKQEANADVGLDESFEHSKTLRIVSILNEIDFGSDSESFLPSDEDWLNFSDDEEDNHPPRSHTGGKWKPGTHPSHCGKGKSIRNSPRTGKGRGKVTSKLRAMELLHKRQSQESTEQTTSRPDTRRMRGLNRGKGPGKGKQMDVHDQPTESSGAHINNTEIACPSEKDEQNEDTDSGKQDVVHKENEAESVQPLISKKTELKKGQEKKPIKVKSEIIDVIECAVCDRSFNNKYNFVRHLNTNYHVSRERGMLRPYILHEKFQSLLLRRKPFQCRICGFFCNSLNVLLEHMRSRKHKDMAGDLVGPQCCSVCKYATQITKEMLTHFQSKDHIATVQKSRRPCVLQERRHNVSCHLCDKKMHSAKALSDHLTVHHRGSLRTTKSKYRRKPALFAKLCPHCKLECANAQVLKMHIRRRHSNERPFRCSHCTVGYADSYSLKIHMLSKQHLELVTALAEVKKKKVPTATLR